MPPSIVCSLDLPCDDGSKYLHIDIFADGSALFSNKAHDDDQRLSTEQFLVFAKTLTARLDKYFDSSEQSYMRDSTSHGCIYVRAITTTPGYLAAIILDKHRMELIHTVLGALDDLNEY